LPDIAVCLGPRRGCGNSATAQSCITAGHGIMRLEEGFIEQQSVLISKEEVSALTTVQSVAVSASAPSSYADAIYAVPALTQEVYRFSACAQCSDEHTTQQVNCTLSTCCKTAAN
jgi:hypothetical protein